MTRSNAEQIAWVPLFVKRPLQRAGTTSTEPIQLIDVLPTIADVLDVNIPWRTDGVPAPTAAQHSPTRLFRTDSETPMGSTT